MRNFLKIVVVICLIFVIRDFVNSKSLLGEAQAGLEASFHRIIADFKEHVSVERLMKLIAAEAPSPTNTSLPHRKTGQMTDLHLQDLKLGLKALAENWQDPKQELETRIPVQSLFPHTSATKCQRIYTRFLIRAAEDLDVEHGLVSRPEPGQVFMKAQGHESCTGHADRSFDLQLHFDCRNSELFLLSKNLKDCTPTYQFLSQRVSCVVSAKDKMKIHWSPDFDSKLKTATPESGDTTLSVRTLLGEVDTGPCAGRSLYQRSWRHNNESGYIRYLVSQRTDDIIVLGQWMQPVPKAYELFSSFQAAAEQQQDAGSLGHPNWFGLSPAQELVVVESTGMKAKRRIFMDLSTEIPPELASPTAESAK